MKKLLLCATALSLVAATPVLAKVPHRQSTAAANAKTAELNRAQLANADAAPAAAMPDMAAMPAPAEDTTTTVTVTGQNPNAAIGNTDANTVSYLPGATTTDTMNSAQTTQQAQANGDQSNLAAPLPNTAEARASAGTKPGNQRPDQQ